MNLHMPPLHSADDFLLWNEGREGRREFVSGRVVEMMTGGTLRHARLCFQLATLLHPSMAAIGLVATVADFGVRTQAGIRYPDVLIHRQVDDGRELATSEPLFLAEILSPSSLAADFGPKAAEYTAIPLLRHYLVLSQDEPRAWLWSGTDGVFGEPEMLVGAEAVLPLAGFDLTLGLAEIYRGIA